MRKRTPREKLTTPISVLEQYKKCTVEERKKPKREGLCVGISYKGREYAKKIELVNPRKYFKPVYIATNLESNKKHELIYILRELRDVFVWSYKDLKGLEPTICRHTISL